MPTQDNQLKRLQDVIVERLKDHDALGGLDIYPETKENLNSELEISLGKLGLVLVVQMGTAGISNSNLSKPVWDSCSVVVEIWEDVMLNRRMSALDAGMEVVEALYHFRLSNLGGLSNKVLNPAPAPRTLTPAVLDGNVGYYANFTIGAAD